LTWVTIILVGVFLLLAVVMGKFYRPSVSDFGDGVAPRQEQPVEAGPPTVGDANAAGGAEPPGG
nr:hypothetical protein [Planctomycetota bacterium]